MCCALFASNGNAFSVNKFSQNFVGIQQNVRGPIRDGLFAKKAAEGDDCMETTRRSVLTKALTSVVAGGGMILSSTDLASAAVGELPEFSETNAILQGLTVNVADPSQQNDMIDFLGTQKLCI